MNFISEGNISKCLKKHTDSNHTFSCFGKRERPTQTRSFHTSPSSGRQWLIKSVLLPLITPVRTCQTVGSPEQMSVDPPRCRVACIYQNNLCFLSLFKRCHLTSLRCTSFVFLDINLGIRWTNNSDYNLMLYAINYFVFHNQCYFSFIHLVL